MPGVVSRRVGCEVMREKRMAEGGLGTVEVVVGGRRLVSSRWLIHGDFFKIGSCKAPRLEKARGDWQPTSRGSNLSEVPLVTFASSEIRHQVLSILRVLLRTHQEDDSQVKSALPVRDFT